jgi:hypothetical protein
MTARTTTQTMLGATLSISASLPATYDATGYGATAMTYTEIGQVENFGNHGENAQVSNFVPVKTGVVFKHKGSRDYGKMSVMFGDVPADAGQVICETASGSQAHYSLKIVYPLGDGEATNAKHYLDVIVTKAETQDGDVNAVRKYGVDFDICRVPVKVAAT